MTHDDALRVISLLGGIAFLMAAAVGLLAGIWFVVAFRNFR